MGKAQDNTDAVDRITGFAMRQTSRRGFIKWLGKGGLAIAAGLTTGLDFLSGTAFASVPCGRYYPGCTGPCTCTPSSCTDGDGGGTQNCEGFCGGCFQLQYYAYIYWYWNGSKCVPSKNCIKCS
jgi:hypothetical protein